ncbi:hypothetical protein [Paraferrimonas sedimenticola]|uniref:Haloacid dehalogenase-like hydrolase n=1 Tax=Paraferrimonas sedimenticola TaxID=375674 RepID=A0AA37RWG7_9GAMM|nr:hypothetical protein [Paraferrimonas sedimenticola]GLP96022.1 hypothetical protein GCM10007895_13280 [Paraferrimonas sedimenticola]
MQGAMANMKLADDYRVNEAQLYSQIDSLKGDEPVIVDFDETLWLRNSTEAFLSNVSPSIWVAFWLQLLGLIRPWRWASPHNHDHVRDWIRVCVVVMVAPWSVWQWKRVAATKAKDYLNRPLAEALKASNQPVFVASYGFQFVIQPMLDALSVSWPLIVASTLRSAPSLRRQGKGAAVAKQLGLPAVQRGLSITDSKLDLDLLAMTRLSALIRWPQAKYIQAGRKPMLPFVYLKKVKRPTESYFTRAILGHDYLLLLLVFSATSSTPIASAICLLLFVLSYFTAYEVGYYENDRLGILHEAKPKVSKAFSELGDNFVPIVAWIFAGLLAIPAAILATEVNGLRQSFVGGMPANAMEVWLVFMGLLVAVRLVFAWFNRLPEMGRVVPMLILQGARSAGYLLLFTTSLVGILFCLTQALSKWIPYVVYRFGGSRALVPNHLINLLLLLSAVGLLSASGQVNGIWDHWHTWLLLGYSALRGVIELRKFGVYLKPYSGSES